MEQHIPMIGFAAYSGTGKTTLVEQLIRLFKQQGLRVAVVKHDGHDFEMDRPGKDSWRFTQAGADITLISSSSKTVILEQRPRSFQENIACLQGVDLILVEGYKYKDLPRVGICRKATGKGLPSNADTYIAVVTDDELLKQQFSGPCFALDDVRGLACFLLEYTGLTC